MYTIIAILLLLPGAALLLGTVLYLALAPRRSVRDDRPAPPPTAPPSPKA